MRILPWQKRRSVFNHDWFKNQFLQAFGKYLNVLEGNVEELGSRKPFLENVLPEWELHSEEVKTLVRDFEQDMSPRTMFGRYPLSLCDDDTKRWLGHCVHILWLKTYPVKCWITEATECVTKVEIAYSRLQSTLSECGDLPSGQFPRGSYDQLIEFRAACHNLATAIEKFPGEVKVP